ncbi:MAG TPA: porin family protein [bacterium]|nr:porin family protein [bacterium]
MKKTFLSAALLLLSAGCVLGEPLSFGVRAGGDMATQVSSVLGQGPQETGDVVFGFTGGVFVETDLGDSLSLQPEVDYVRKGLQMNLNGVLVTGPGLGAAATVNATYTYTYDYVEIPVLLKAHTLLSPGLTGSLSAGPEVGILLGANEHYSIPPYGTGDVAYKGAGVDWGVLVGAGLELDGFLLDLRYDRGLISANQYSKGPANSVLSLDVGYRVQ